MKISIVLNGENRPLDSSCKLNQFLRDQEQAGPVAVAINGQFVPQSQYEETDIKDGDNIEIVAPMQGG